MANKKISELPYIDFTKISGNTLIPLVTYYSAVTGDTVHTYTDDLKTYILSGNTDIFVTGGTYTNGIATFTNNSGGTFNVVGFYTGETSYVNSLVTGTGLSANTTTGDITIINTQPDQVVTISGGTGILTGGTYPNFTITNTLPDQTVVLNNGSNINVTGSYPNFTINVTGLTDNNRFVTGFTYQDNTFTILDNSGSTYTATINDVTGLTVNGDITITGTTFSDSISATTYQNLPDNVTGNYLPLSGGTVSGYTNFQSGVTINSLSATTIVNTYLDSFYIRDNTGTVSINSTNRQLLKSDGSTISFDWENGILTGQTNIESSTISATTYQNLPLDVFVTGGTYNLGTATFTNNSGGTFNVTGFVTGDTYVTGLTFNTSNYNLTIGRNDGVTFTDSLAILASDLTVTGGTYDPNTGVATFTNNTGGTFNVTGFLTGFTDTFVTGGTYSSGTATFTNTSGGTFNVSGFYTGETSYVNSLTTGYGLSGDSTTGDITLINTLPDQTVVLNNGTNINVTGTYPNFTIDVTGLTDNNRFVTGFTYNNNTFTISDNSGSTYNATINVVTGLTINGNLNVTGNTILNNLTANTITATTISADTITATDYENLAFPDDLTLEVVNGFARIKDIVAAPSGGTRTFQGDIVVVNGFTADTISATTYYNLPLDVFVTGGTYSTGTTTFTNNTGGTFNVTGFYTGETSVVNSITTGTGLSGDSTTGNVTLINTQPDQEVTISGGTGILTGGTYPNFTLTNSAPDQTVVLNNGSNISVTGTYPNFTIDVTGLTDLNTYVTGFTYQDNTFTISDNSGSTFNATIDTVTGLTINGDLTITGTTTSETISATTYQNLPTDIRVTGATYNNNTFTYTNNTGGTFNTSFNTVTGLTINGNLTVTGNTSLQNLTATTISATTYQNLPVSGLTAGTNITITGSNSNFTISASITTGPFGISNSGGTYTYYSTLSSAMSAATSGQVIEMFTDVTETSGTAVELKPGVTLQGNGHTYRHTSTTGNTFNVTTTGTYNFMNINIKRNVTTPGASSFIFGCNPGGAFFQTYTLLFQGSYVEYIWSTSTGATQITGPSANVSVMYIDGIRAVANGSGTMFASARIQTLKNSIIENTGTGSCFSSDNITGGSYIENCHLKTNSGTVVSFNYTAQGDGIRNSTVISTSGIGVSGGYAYDTSSFSNTNRSFSGVICYMCAGSTGSGTVYYSSTASNSTGVSSTGYVVVPFFTLSSFFNCTFNAVTNIVAYDTGYAAAFYNCVLSTSYNNAAGHAISLAGSGNVLVNCYVSVANASANCFRGTSAISAKYSNNVFAGATTPVNSNVTQSIVNTQDNQGNILI